MNPTRSIGSCRPQQTSVAYLIFASAVDCGAARSEVRVVKAQCRAIARLRLETPARILMFQKPLDPF